MFEKLIKYIPFIYIIIVVLSYIQIHNYYDKFGIGIDPYVSVYELLFYFIPYFFINYANNILIPYYLFIALIVLFVVLGEILLSKQRKRLKTLKLKCLIYFDDPILYFNRFSKFQKLLYSIITIILFLIFYCLTYKLISFNRGNFEWIKSYVDNKNGENYHYFLFYFSSWCILFYVILLKLFTFFYKYKKVIIFHNILAIIIFVFVFSITKSNYYVSKVYQYGPYDKVTFNYLNDSNVISTVSNVDTTKDSNKVFIGVLKDYLFIGDFNHIDKTTKKITKFNIYDLKDVKNLEIESIRR